jgi:Golgi CORVET complex core vacuolar protein 8
VSNYNTKDTNDSTYEIAIRVAIEFCINIQSVDFLFGN